MSELPRRFPCHRPGCARRAVKLGGYCSRSCNRRWHLLGLQTPEQRSAQMRRARALQQQQEINRMLVRVKVLADTEDARLVLAWRYGKNAAKSARYRQRQICVRGISVIDHSVQLTRVTG